MTFMIKHYETTVTITVEDEGLDATEAVQKVYELLLAVGYHPNSVAEAFGQFAMSADA